MKWPWAFGTDSESGGPEAALEQIVHACLGRQEPPPGVDATQLRANIDERLRNESPKFLSWVQESRDRLDSAQAEASRQASRTEFAGWAIAGALAVYLALALGFPGSGAGLDAEIIGGLAVALVGRLAWRLRLFARGERKVSDARKHWEKVLEEAIALPLIAQEMNLLLGDDVACTMDMNVATLTGNGRDPEVPVISAAMKNVAATARTIGSGSIGISGPRGAGKSTVLSKFDTRDAAWKSAQDIRVTVAAPVDYDAREFIIHLFTELCLRVAAEAPAQDRIARRTQRHLEDLRFQRTYSSSWGPTLMPASFLSFAWSRGKQRAEQPAGLPALVAQFRAYSQQVAEWNWDRNRDRSQVSNEAKRQAQGQVQRPFQRQGQEGVGRVIICIDEMDKIRDSDRAEAFLNDVKAIFGVPGCLYLVSLSEDAMAGFARRTPSIRSAFDSAFDELVPVGPMTYVHSEQLLFKRVTGVPRPFIALCHVLAGGLPRDLVRAARALIDVTPAAGERSLPDTAGDLIGRELESLRQASIRQLADSSGPSSLLAALHDRQWPGTTPAEFTDAARQMATAARDADSEVTRQLCLDVVVSLSFCATALGVFGAERDRLVGCLKDQNHAMIDDLAAARYAMRVNTGLAHRLLERYRLANQMGPAHGTR